MSIRKVTDTPLLIDRRGLLLAGSLTASYTGLAAAALVLRRIKPAG